MTGYEIVETGRVSASDGGSVYVSFDVSADERTEIATILSEYIDLDSVPEHDRVARAYLLDAGDVAVDVSEGAVGEHGW